MSSRGITPFQEPLEAFVTDRAAAAHFCRHLGQTERTGHLNGLSDLGS